MKAVRVFWHKARLQERYVLEMEIFQVGKSSKYPDGLKYGLVLVDTKSGRKVLMDNHHPKGPHVHLDEQELPYEFVDEDTLIRDFKSYALSHLGVKL